MTDDGRIHGYLARLGVPRGEPTAALLRTLHRRHVDVVPFENLSIHLGESITHEPDALIDKVTQRRRGGFCYELNGAFAELLRTLGYTVELLEGRVYGADGPGIRFDHLTLCVMVDRPYLVDVGFGAGFHEPLALDSSAEQYDRAGRFRIVERPDGWFDLLHDDAAQYVFSRQPRRLEEFADGCAHHQSSPLSPFTQGTICSLPTATGRITLRNNRLIVSDGDERVERELDPDEVREVLAREFEITLDGPLPARLTAMLGRQSP